MKNFLIFLFFLTNSFSVLAIRNGVVVSGHSFPTVGYLVLSSGGSCSATLIAPNLIITADHCTDHLVGNKQSTEMKFLLPSSREIFQIILTYKYPSPTMFNDVALMILDHDSMVRPSPLNTQRHPTDSYKNPPRLKILGYGMTGNEQMGLDDLLASRNRRIKNVIENGNWEEMIPLKLGEVQFQKYNKVFDMNQLDDIELLMYVSPVNDSIFCYGDSGGPVFIEKEGRLMLDGVISQIVQNDLSRSSLSSACNVAHLGVVSPIIKHRDWVSFTFSRFLVRGD